MGISSEYLEQTFQPPTFNSFNMADDAGSVERTFICLKPDAVQRGLIGEIIGRFEKKGFQLVGMKFIQVSKEFAAEHYADLSSKGFFDGLCDFFSSGPVCAMVWQGLGVVATGRKMLGTTNPADSAPGTIRGDFAVDMGRNICHGSDSVESANNEIEHWFKPEELVDWQPTMNEWVYE